MREQLQRVVERAKQAAVKKARLAVYNLAHEVIETSPVRMPERWFKHYPYAPPGHYKANWQVGINAPKTTELNAFDDIGYATITKAETALLNDIDYSVKTFYITNNTKYAFAIENDIGINRETWTYELSDKGITAPNTVLGRAILNWRYHVKAANNGEEYVPF